MVQSEADKRLPCSARRDSGSAVECDTRYSETTIAREWRRSREDVVECGGVEEYEDRVWRYSEFDMVIPRRRSFPRQGRPADGARAGVTRTSKLLLRAPGDYRFAFVCEQLGRIFTRLCPILFLLTRNTAFLALYRMAENLQNLSQLLQLSLDPRQSKQGTLNVRENHASLHAELQ